MKYFEKAEIHILRKFAFTLAEILCVLVILGVVAAITIPTTVNRTLTRTSRTRLQKAMASYEQVMEKVVIEYNFRSISELKTWAEANNCENIRPYFHIKSGTGCNFETSDDIVWDLSEVDRPVVIVRKNQKGINENNILSDENKSVFFMQSFFDKNGSLRVNDLNYLEKEEDYINYAYLQKTYSFAFNKDYGDSKIDIIKYNNGSLTDIGIAPGETRIIAIDGANGKYTYKITNTSGENSKIRIMKIQGTDHMQGEWHSLQGYNKIGTTYIKGDKIKVEENNGKDSVYIEGSDIEYNWGDGPRNVTVNSGSGYVNLNGGTNFSEEMNNINVLSLTPILD